MEDRGYQGTAVRSVCWGMQCEKRMLLVAPTGAGKTHMGAMVASRLQGRGLWVTHTKDLVEQSAQKLQSSLPRVGIIAAGRQPDPFAPVQVVSIQTLVARELELTADWVIIDEAHHFVADDWRAGIDSIKARRFLGLTATPERGDGRPLGDLFDDLVVAASYSELTRAGYLVPLRVLRPASALERGLAKKAVEAYAERGEGRSGFVFCRTKKEAADLAEALRAVAPGCDAVTDETDSDERKARLEALAAGSARLLTNVHALTEGVDVPAASVAVYARNLGHVGVMLQTAGRILRPAPGKTDALLLDLPGVTHRLGLPNEDREYSLKGDGIRRTAKGMALRVCMFCGMTSESGGPCPRCGKEAEVKKVRPMRIYNQELQAVYAGGATPDWAKRAELDRLRATAQERGYDAWWVTRQYQALFGAPPPAGQGAGEEEKRAELGRLLRQASRMGYSSGWAQHRYKAAYGAFPPRRWVQEAERKDADSTCP